ESVRHRCMEEDPAQQTAMDVDSYVANLLESQPDNFISRYRHAYEIGPECCVTKEMLHQHWKLERLLTKQLLNSSPPGRASAFERAYTALYVECPWLNRPRAAEPGSTLEGDYTHCAKLLRGRKNVYERSLLRAKGTSSGIQRMGFIFPVLNQKTIMT